MTFSLAPSLSPGPAVTSRRGCPGGVELRLLAGAQSALQILAGPWLCPRSPRSSVLGVSCWLLVPALCLEPRGQAAVADSTCPAPQGSQACGRARPVQSMSSVNRRQSGLCASWLDPLQPFTKQTWGPNWKATEGSMELSLRRQHLPLTGPLSVPAAASLEARSL